MKLERRSSLAYRRRPRRVTANEARDRRAAGCERDLGGDRCIDNLRGAAVVREPSLARQSWLFEEHPGPNACSDESARRAVRRPANRSSGPS